MLCAATSGVAAAAAMSPGAMPTPPESALLPESPAAPVSTVLLESLPRESALFESPEALESDASPEYSEPFASAAMPESSEPLESPATVESPDAAESSKPAESPVPPSGPEPDEPHPATAIDMATEIATPSGRMARPVPDLLRPLMSLLLG